MFVLATGPEASCSAGPARCRSTRRNLRIGPQRGMALVGRSPGPITNFLLAILFGADLMAHGTYSGHRRWRFSATPSTINIVLGVFNLLPIPPLDGSRIVGGFMDRQHVRSRGRRSTSTGWSSCCSSSSCSRDRSRRCCSTPRATSRAIISDIVGGDADRRVSAACARHVRRRRHAVGGRAAVRGRVARGVQRLRETLSGSAGDGRGAGPGPSGGARVDAARQRPAGLPGRGASSGGSTSSAAAPTGSPTSSATTSSTFARR